MYSKKYTYTYTKKLWRMSKSCTLLSTKPFWTNHRCKLSTQHYTTVNNGMTMSITSSLWPDLILFSAWQWQYVPSKSSEVSHSQMSHKLWPHTNYRIMHAYYINNVHIKSQCLLSRLASFQCRSQMFSIHGTQFSCLLLLRFLSFHYILPRLVILGALRPQWKYG